MFPLMRSTHYPASGCVRLRLGVPSRCFCKFFEISVERTSAESGYCACPKVSDAEYKRPQPNPQELGRRARADAMRTVQTLSASLLKGCSDLACVISNQTEAAMFSSLSMHNRTSVVAANVDRDVTLGIAQHQLVGLVVTAREGAMLDVLRGRTSSLPTLAPFTMA